MQSEQSTSIISNSNAGERDELLWQLAKKRAAFKLSAITYILVNTLLVAVWFFTGTNSYFWPIWPILGWGFGIVMQYVTAYHGTQLFSAEKEYQKLKNQQ